MGGGGGDGKVNANIKMRENLSSAPMRFIFYSTFSAVPTILEPTILEKRSA